MRRIGGRDKPWGEILRAMRSGHLEFWLAPQRIGGRPIPFVKRASVLPDALMEFETLEFDEDAHPDFRFFSPNMTQLDACELLNVDSAQMVTISEAGGLKFQDAGKRLMIPKARVLLLAQRMMSPAELCLRSGIHPSSVHKAMADRRDVAKVFVGWNREDVERSLLRPLHSTTPA